MEGSGTCRSSTGRDIKHRNTSQPRWICLGWGSSVPTACSRGKASGSSSPPAVWAPGSRWVIGVVDFSTLQSLPSPAAHNNLLQGYYSHCHSDATIHKSHIPLHWSLARDGLPDCRPWVCLLERMRVMSGYLSIYLSSHILISKCS